MPEDLNPLTKLHGMSPAGKMKDSKEDFKGKGTPRRKKGGKQPSDPEPSSAGDPETGGRKEGEGKDPEPSSGRVVDIII